MPVRDSLRQDYHLPDERVHILPPSLDLPRIQPGVHGPRDRRQILFLGGDFVRKGGPLLLEAFRGGLSATADLHIITHSEVPPEPGVFVHRGVQAGSPAWHERWSQADVFVFPSTLETFGIVLLEALAFQVPVVSSRAGAACDILEDGRNGILLHRVSPEAIRTGIESVLAAPDTARERALLGRARVERDFDLAHNTLRLAELIRAVIPAA